MFPTECLMVRRDRRKKTVSPVFLGPEAEEYFFLVMQCFRDNIGKRKHDIEQDLKIIELKVQYNKVIRGLAEIVFRLSKVERPNSIEPSDLRNIIFLRFPNGITSPEERTEKLGEIARELNLTVRQVEESLYSDKEGEQIISSLPDLTFDDAARLYNLEQAETLFSKATGFYISGTEEWGTIIRRIRSLGLLFKVNEDQGRISSIYVSGPASINEKTHRYGIRMSQLLPSLLRVREWKIEADIELKEERSDGKFKMFLSSGSSDMFPHPEQEEPEILPTGVYEAKPLKVGEKFIFPDYVISKNGDEILVFVSRLSYLEADQEMERYIDSHGRKSLFVYRLDNGEKKRKGIKCFSGDIPWDLLTGGYDTSKKKYEESISTNETAARIPLSQELMQIRDEIESMLGDAYSVMDLLRSKGYDAENALLAMGYKIDWKTLEPSIIPIMHN